MFWGDMNEIGTQTHCYNHLKNKIKGLQKTIIQRETIIFSGSHGVGKTFLLKRLSEMDHVIYLSVINVIYQNSKIIKGEEIFSLVDNHIRKFSSIRCMIFDDTEILSMSTFNKIREIYSDVLLIFVETKIKKFSLKTNNVGVIKIRFPSLVEVDSVIRYDEKVINPHFLDLKMVVTGEINLHKIYNKVIV